MTPVQPDAYGMSTKPLLPDKRGVARKAPVVPETAPKNATRERASS